MINVGILGAGASPRSAICRKLRRSTACELHTFAGALNDGCVCCASGLMVPRYSTRWRELLNDDELDAVIVALPHPLHAEAGVAVLERGRHLFVQKPLCTSMAEADQLVAASDSRPGQIVYCLPSFGPAACEMRRRIATGAIGLVSGALSRHSHGGPEVYYAEVTDAFEEPRVEGDFWFFDAEQAGGGALIDMGVYAIANLVTLLGRVEAVSARMTTAAKPTSLEDTATLILEFAGGALATAETGWCDPARSSLLRVHGTAGKLVQAGDIIEYIRPSSAEREWAAPLVETIVPPPVPNPHDEWLRCIESGTQPDLSNLWAARHVMETVLAAEESNRRGHRISVHSKPYRT